MGTVKQEKIEQVLNTMLKNEDAQQGKHVDYFKTAIEPNYTVKDVTFHLHGVTLDYHGFDVEYGNDLLKGVDFSGITFENCNFSHVNLSQANLKGAKFVNCEFESTNFSNSNLENAVFDQCDLTDAVLENSILTNASIKNSVLNYTSFSSSTLNCTSISDVKEAFGANFSDLDNRSDITFNHCHLVDAVLDSNQNLYTLNDSTHDITKPVVALLWNNDTPGETAKLCYGSLKDRDCIPLRVHYNPEVDDKKMALEVANILKQYNSSSEKSIAEFLITHAKSSEQAIEIRRVIENAEKKLNYADAILVPGGKDIQSEFYGEQQHPNSKPDDNYRRSIFEFATLNFADNIGLPTLGICRGAQITSVYRGGTMDQRVEGHNGRLNSLAVKEEGQKGILAGILEKNRLSVISFHSQAIKKLGKRLKNVASVKYNDTEIVKLAENEHGAPLLLSQAHPEYQEMFVYKPLLTASNRLVISSLVDCAETKMLQKKLISEVMSTERQDAKNINTRSTENNQVNVQLQDMQTQFIAAITKQCARLIDINSKSGYKKAEKINVYKHEILSTKSVDDLEKLSNRILKSKVVNDRRTTFANTYFGFFCNLSYTSTRRQLAHDFNVITKAYSEQPSEEKFAQVSPRS